MLQRLSAAIAVLFLFGCASGAPLVFRPYRACAVDPQGRTRPGTVVAERIARDEGGRQVRVYVMQLDENEADGRHFQDIRRITRDCGALDKGGVAGRGVGERESSAPPDLWPERPRR